MKGREAVLEVFDRLFDQAARKLALECDGAARDEARQQFADRFSFALDAADAFGLDGVPEEATRSMEEALADLSPAQVAGHLAALPIAHHAQQMMRSLAFRAAEQRVLRHLIDQADDQYGGN